MAANASKILSSNVGSLGTHGKPANYKGHSTTQLGRRRKKSSSVVK